MPPTGDTFVNNALNTMCKHGSIHFFCVLYMYNIYIYEPLIMEYVFLCDTQVPHNLFH